MDIGLNFANFLSNIAQANIFWLVFLLLISIVGTYSLFLLYHWMRYGMNSITVWIVMIIYFAVAFVLAGIMLLAVMSIV